MYRTVLVLLLFVASGASASWQAFPAPSDLPNANAAGEPTIGIPWNTDDVFFMAGESVYRVHFDGEPTWDVVTPPNSITNVDPMLHADPDLGRVWAGGLDGPCSVMSYTDDNGETWIPTGNMCTGAHFDHQSLGSGPAALLPTTAFDHVMYYCAQLGDTACITSLDGGVTWTPPQLISGDCGGLHGHIRVSRITGTAVVPHKDCGGRIGFGYTLNDGLMWQSRVHPDAPAVQGSFDPSIQFGRGEGWMWMGHAGPAGAHIGLSRDEGLTWAELGGTNQTWFDVGALHDPPIVHAHFADVQVGDDDRVAFSFLGLEDKGTPYGSLGDCGAEGQDDMLWHYYVAMSIDAGRTWTVERVTEDPVQVGAVFTGGFAPGTDSSCRNLLDFNDMDIDSTGRVYVAFADGCINDCAEEPSVQSSGARSRYATIVRQMDGPALFLGSDENVTVPTPEPSPEPSPDNDSPGLGLVALLGALAIVLRRR